MKEAKKTPRIITTKTVLSLMVCLSGLVALSVLIIEFRWGIEKTLDLGTRAEFRRDLLGRLWDFLLIVVLGGAVGLLFTGYERKKERSISEKESLLRTRADLVTAYNKAKSVRRLLRDLALKHD